MDDNLLRLAIFVGVLALMMCLEAAAPKRARQQPRSQRWPTNLLLAAINTVCLKLLGPISAVIAAEYALDQGWGVLAYSPIPLPLYMEVIIGVILLDAAIYLQHVASHRIPFLWQFHKVHHADRDIDTTTGIRFHPVEAVFSMAYKCIVVLLLGPIALAVIIFEVILNASALFNHANVRLPTALDKLLRKVIVTPDFHRVHHSVIVRETNSNYGFFLSIWDRLGRTYIAQPQHQHQDMTIGLTSYQSPKPAALSWCLTLPFRKIPKQEKSS